MPGLNASPVRVVVRAPEQARFALGTPSPMCASAALERWQPGIDSRPETSWYAVEPRASTRDEDWFVLPAQRPASPEIAESPSVTTAGAPTPGPSAAACAGPHRDAAMT